MRGTYSIAALKAFAERGWTERFSDIYATSAGALNGAYFIAGQAAEGVTIYTDFLSNRRFVDKRRIRKVIDIDYLVDVVLKEKVPLDVDRVVAAPTKLHIGMFSTSSGELVWADNRGSWPLMEALRATAALPVVYGREVEIGDDSFVDGGVKFTVPLAAAIEANHKEIVVILTRPASYEPPTPSRTMTGLMRAAARLQGHSKPVVEALGKQDHELAQTLELLDRAGEGHPVKMWVIAPSGAIAGRLTVDRGVLLETAETGYGDAMRVLDGSVNAASSPQPG